MKNMIKKLEKSDGHPPKSRSARDFRGPALCQASMHAMEVIGEMAETEEKEPV